MKLTAYTETIINSLLEVNNREFNLNKYIDLVTKMDKCYPSELERGNYSLIELENNHNNITYIQKQINLLNDKSFIWLYSSIMETILSENMVSCKGALHILLGSNDAQVRIESIIASCKKEQWYQNAYYQLLNMNNKSNSSIELKAV
ncbi:hypothetical protein O0Q50_22190 [Priestia aryabhattai]|uniref:Immunity protein 30 domain-containing protein n=1 Tax=Priestia aryabhattai TaxID=412384 RepID=A0AAX6NEH3_PRIAR|nr:hypothetical protein [Priestia aryabhattai]MDU9693894.1 hypothetical protein [Priestia aryabhattai]